jgi:2-keto-3-deoxy-L-arabinonate dehydratase
MSVFNRASIPPGPCGIIPSLNTPFAADGSLDDESLGRLVDYVIEAGCAGMLALAVAGETNSLSMAEKSRVVDIVSARNAGRLPLIVGITASSWKDSLELARLARDCRAAAVLWQPVTGTAEDRLEEGLIQLGETGPGPVVLQDLDWDGPGLPLDTIVRLFDKVPSFCAIKIETQTAGPKYSQVLAATSGRLHVSGGWAAAQMIDALSRGVHAFIPTGMEPVYNKVHHLFVAGDPNAAESLFESVRPVLAFSNRDLDSSIRFFKALRTASGIFSGDHCRPPVKPLDEGDLADCRCLVDTAMDIERGF